MQQSFAYHRTVAPMIWGLAMLAVCEMLLMHLVLASRSPALRWALLFMSVGSVFLLVFWIRSFRHFPHLLTTEHLRLHTGLLPPIIVPISAIESVATYWEPGEHKGDGAANVVPLAHPNRMLRLKAPIKTRKGLCDRVAFRVDDAAPFDAAMERLGISVR